MTDKKRFETIVKIVERAEEIGYNGQRITLIMDIENADKVFNLRLEDLLNADIENFIHDIGGIINNIDRSKSPVTESDFNLFVPRYATIK